MWKMKFAPAARYPADPRAVFILALSVFSALTALTLEAAPQSLEATIPHWGVVLWGVLLGAGSAVTLAGMSSQTDTGIIVEQVGSVTVGAATLFYSGIALYISPSAIQSIGIVFAWGVACFIRWGQLQALINTSYRRARRERLIMEATERILGSDEETR